MEDYLKVGNLHRVWIEKMRPYFEEHGCGLSDLLRVLLVYQYGGAYLDTDTISKLPLPSLPNFITKGNQIFIKS